MNSNLPPSPTCQDVAGLLQPYVDGELGSEDIPRVAEHIERCAACRAVVGEQAWVRTLLAGVAPHRAPAHLERAVRSALDEAQRSDDGLLSGIGRRFAAFFRGGLVMVPAGTVALAILVAARAGLFPGVAEPGPDEVRAEVAVPAAAPTVPEARAEAQAPLPSEVLDRLAALEPEVGFAVQPPADGIELVSAHAYPAQAAAERPRRAHLEVRVPLPDGTGFVRVRDVQERADVPTDGGTKVKYRGRTYDVYGDETDPRVAFVAHGVRHVLSLSEPPTEAQAQELARTKAGARHGPTTALLLRVADRLATAVEARRGATRLR
ncbi:MAG: zf-HC2 domain-containing protein [Deltaproteobacteria bacterium]|nr:MAG: zf-HC2 domain-containing protein [Deltaproteobacteria bacterium]